MTIHSLIRNLETDEITVMSHVTSTTVVGNKISKLEADAGDASTSTIHLNFEVRDKHEQPCVLANAEELGLILSPKDALELGLILVAMGMEQHTEAETRAVQNRLAETIAQLHPQAVGQ
jgi:urease accessory protein UreE